MKTRIYTAGLADENQVRQLDLTFMRELPAFWVEDSSIGCFQTLVTVATEDSTPDWAFGRLNGFPIAGTRLQEVVAQ